MTLHELLTAKLDEIEALAMAAADCEGTPEPDWTAHSGGGKSDAEVTSRRASVAFCDDDPIAEHIAAWDPATVLRAVAEDRALLAIVVDLRTKAAAKDASADRMGDPADPDMTGPDRIAWLLQRDIAEDLRETANALEMVLARRLGLEVPNAA